MYSIPVWRGPAGGLEPEDRTRVDAAIETAETINARIGEATEAAEIATEAAAATDADAQATEAGRQHAVQAAGDAAAARAGAEAASHGDGEPVPDAVLAEQLEDLGEDGEGDHLSAHQSHSSQNGEPSVLIGRPQAQRPNR